MSASVMSTAPPKANSTGPASGTGPSGSAEWLAALMKSVAEETITPDERLAEAQRQELSRLAGAASGLKSAAEFEHWHGSARAKLKVYRTEVERRVAQLRKDLDSTSTALQEAMQAISQVGEDQTTQLESELDHLGRLRTLYQVEDIHRGIDAVSNRLNDVVKNMQVQNSLVVAQMRDEIRTLQQRLETAERRDRAAPGNLSHRGIFERKIEAKIGANEIFALFLVRISNWKELLPTLTQDQAQVLTNQVAARLGKVLGAETFAGRWYEGYYAAIVSASKRQAIGASQEIVHGVSGMYELAKGEKPIRISTRVAVIEHYEGQLAEHMLRRVDELIRAFEGNG